MTNRKTPGTRASTARAASSRARKTAARPRAASARANGGPDEPKAVQDPPEEEQEEEKDEQDASVELGAEPIDVIAVEADDEPRPARASRAVAAADDDEAPAGTLAVVVRDGPETRRDSGPGRDSVGRFIAEVRRHPRLSEDEERALGRAVREHGDVEAARRLVVHNLRLVVSIAHQYRRAWANILDLFQEGSVGLLEAVKRWEPSLGPRFGSYAAYWIRAYVLKFLMTNSRLIHVGNTRAGRKLFFRLEKERQKLLAEGFEPTPKLLAAKLDVNEDDLNEVRRHLESREVSFDPQGVPGEGEGEGGYPLSERIALQQASPEQNAASAEMSGALHEVMGHFQTTLKDDRERAVWNEHLAASEPVPLGEIGARFGVSKQRMGQIADGLKKRFRERIVDRMGPDIRTDWLGGEE